MRIFLTGATGYVGSAVLQALARGGHEVCALIRNPREATQSSLLDAPRRGRSRCSSKLCGRG
ncbi:MAG: NmrA family NAD(P)-binding protein [Acidobacteria bacterium]|nr:NmrA family NAD(P)-binding protein [Acidobacteriota bacterium]